MASDVKECYDWGILGCGWLGLAFARSVLDRGGSVWGTARSIEGLSRISEAGVPAFKMDLNGTHLPAPGPPPCRSLLVALPSGVGHSGIMSGYRTCLSAYTQWTVLISSTSVYPMEPGRYTESDAVHRISPHSGVSVLEIEEAMAGPACSILRAGGLVGPGRPMFRRPPGEGEHQRTMTAIHRDDVVSAIWHARDQSLVGPSNLVCPIVRSRTDCRRGQSHDTGPAIRARHIPADRLMDSGFTFSHPDPMSMPDRVVPSTS